VDGKSLKRGEQLIFSLPLFVKDFSTLHSNRVTVVHLVDAATDSKSAFFPGIGVSEMLTSEEAREKVFKALKQLLKFNVFLEVALNTNADGYMIISSDLT